MASLEKRNLTYRIVFVYEAKRYGYSPGTEDRREAEVLRGGVEKILMRVDQKLVKVPDGISIVDYIKHDANVENIVTPKPTELSFEEFRKLYIQTHENGAMESNSLDTVRIHLQHIADTLGNDFPVKSLSVMDLQRHIARRSSMKGFGNRPLSPITIRKELASFRAAWNWGLNTGLVPHTFPNKGLVFPKTEEKPPFMTWGEIERRIRNGKLSESQQAELWDALFLTLKEIQELLSHVYEVARQPWVYQMFVFAAHTGARRSEIIRAQIEDVDFESASILIREKKRARGRRTTRRVPMTAFLAETLRTWLATERSGAFLFSLAASATSSVASDPISKNEAHDHFKRTLAGSNWEVIRGWHVPRHSFASNCAARGVDQRLIDSWLGHTTEIRRRYLHLIPSNEQKALGSVFD